MIVLTKESPTRAEDPANRLTAAATDPNDLDETLRKWIFEQNMFYASIYTEQHKNPLTIWAAWGVSIKKRAYLVEGLKGFSCLFEKYNWITIGKRSKDGHPHHPLYLPSDAEVKDFNVTEYLKGF